MKTLFSLLFVLLFFDAFTQDYDIYVSDAGNFNKPPWQILKFDANGSNPEVFIDSNSVLNWPQDILFLEESDVVLISNLGSGAITRHDATTGAYLSDFATGIGGPTRFKIGPDGLLYVLQWVGDGKVKRYRLDGTFVDDFTETGVASSIGLDWDQAGNLYVSSYKKDLVQKYSPEGKDLGAFIDSNLAGPTNIWFDTNGDLLVSDYDATAIKRFDKAGNYMGEFLTGTGHSEGVAYLPDGNILIGNGSTSSVKLFDASGKFIKDLISSGSANLLNPNAVVIRKHKK
ncbi:MAG: hypothetical protein KDD41_08170 [Flavobacteriales bacterium]|nr:hypothetical protein [Flavobacteriales bacterium]